MPCVHTVSWDYRGITNISVHKRSTASTAKNRGGHDEDGSTFPMAITKKMTDIPPNPSR